MARAGRNPVVALLRALAWGDAREVARRIAAVVRHCVSGYRHPVAVYVTRSGSVAALVRGRNDNGRCSAIAGRGAFMARAELEGGGALWVVARRAGRSLLVRVVLVPRRGRPRAAAALCDAETGLCALTDAL